MLASLWVPTKLYPRATGGLGIDVLSLKPLRDLGFSYYGIICVEELGNLA